MLKTTAAQRPANTDDAESAHGGRRATKTKKLNVRIPEYLEDELRKFADQNSVSLGSAVGALVLAASRGGLIKRRKTLGKGVPFGCQVTPSLLGKFRQKCKAEGLSFRNGIEHALTRWLKDQKGNSK